MAAKQITDGCEGTVSIVGAGPSVLMSYTTTSGETGSIVAHVIARDTSGRHASWFGQVGYQNIGGTLTQGTVTPLATSHDAAFTLSVTVSVSGAALQFSVSNGAAVNADYYGEGKVLRC